MRYMMVGSGSQESLPPGVRHIRSDPYRELEQWTADQIDAWIEGFVDG